MGNEDRETIYRNIGSAKEVEELNREKSMRKVWEEKRITDSFSEKKRFFIVDEVW